MTTGRLSRYTGIATVAAFTAILCIGPVAAAADPKGRSLQDKRSWSVADKRLAKKAHAVRRACGFSLRAAYSPRSYRGRALPSHTRNHCENALYIVQLLCGKPVGREVVKKKVRALSCQLSSRGTGATLRGRTLVVHIDPKSNSIRGRKKGSYSWKSAIEELL